MAEITHFTQLAETAGKKLHVETTTLKDEQTRQNAMMETILQQVNNMVSSYKNILQITTKIHSGEGSSNIKVNFNPLFEGLGGIQVRTLCLDFPKFARGDPNEWIPKAQQFFSYYQIPEEHKLQIASFHMEGKALSWFR